MTELISGTNLEFDEFSWRIEVDYKSGMKKENS